MGLNTSTYYYNPKVFRSERERHDADLRDQIEFIQVEYSAYGYRTIRTHLMRHYGLRVNGKRIRRIMHKYSLFQKTKKRFISTTDSNHDYRVYPNLLKGLEVRKINQVWVADITYIRILTGFVYLAVVLDIFSRRVVGWALSKRIAHRLTVSALQMAIEARKPSTGITHHSDRGVQYACLEYVKILKEHQFEISMSAVGNPYDNAFAESFMKTLKKEEVYLWEYESFTDVVERVPQFIESVYNKKRVHSGIQYLPPEEFEDILLDENRKHQLGQVTLKLSG